MGAAFVYLGTPIFTWTKTLPSPIEWNGVPESEFPTHIYLILYVALFYSTVNVVLMIMATDSFFAIAVVILGMRFATIAGLLKQLNYSGERNRKKDQELIKYCYQMHLDVLR